MKPHILFLCFALFANFKGYAKYTVPKWFLYPEDGEYVGVGINDVDTVTSFQTALSSALLSYYISHREEKPDSLERVNHEEEISDGNRACISKAMWWNCDSMTIKYAIVRKVIDKDKHCWLSIRADENATSEVTLFFNIETGISFIEKDELRKHLQLGQVEIKWDSHAQGSSEHELFDYDTNMYTMSIEDSISSSEDIKYTAMIRTERVSELIDARRIISISPDGVDGIEQDDSDTEKEGCWLPHDKYIEHRYGVRFYDLENSSLYHFPPDIGVRYFFSLLDFIEKTTKRGDYGRYKNKANYIGNNVCLSLFDSIVSVDDN